MADKKEGSSRIAYWDNLKAFLIFMVVLGHFVLLFRNKSNMLLSIFYYIYLFHMPAFVFVSGFFSKSYVKKGAPVVSKLFGFLSIYLIIKVPCWYADGIRLGKLPKLDWFSEGSAPWYVLAMVSWLLIIPVFAKLKARTGIIIALIIGMVAPLSYKLSDFLALNRVLILLIFFVLGYYFKAEYIEIFKKKSVKLLAAIILLIIAILVMQNLDLLVRYGGVIYANNPYHGLKTSLPTALLIKCLWYFIALIMTICVMALCPRKKLFFSYVGGGTLSVYIIHRIIRDVMYSKKVFEPFTNNSFALLLSLTFVSLALTFVLSEIHLAKLCNLPFKMKLDKKA